MKIFEKQDKKVSLTRQSFLFSLIVLFFISLANGWSSYFRQVETFRSESARDEAVYLERELESAKKEVLSIQTYIANETARSREDLEREIQDRVREAHALAFRLHETYRASMREETLKSLIRDMLGAIRFHDGRGYFFIYRMDGTNVLLPTQPELQGTGLWDLQDVTGGYTIRKAAAIAASEEGEGFLNWYWYKPGETDGMYEKTGYIMGFEPYGWFIGTGEYLYDIENDLKEKVLDNLEKIYTDHSPYVFIGKSDGTVVMAPYAMDNFYELDSSGGQPVWDVVKNIAREGQGFVDYRLPENALGYAYSKTSYVAYFPEWDWYVGSGIDLDRVAGQNLAKREELNRIVYKDLLSDLLLFLATFTVAVYLFAYYHRNLRREFAIMDTFLANASETYKPLDPERFRYLELFNLAETANRMIREIRKQRGQLKDYSERMERLARIDSLTRLLNHRAIMENVQARVREAERYKTPLSVIMIDIDNFKQINDRYGHPFGDKVLMRVAAVLQDTLRETDLTGRYGGEEFLIVLPNTDADRAFLAAEKIRRAIESLEWGKPDLTVTVSGGVSEHTGRHYHRLIGEADQKLYRAKAQGKNRMVK